ncbi:DciA family protein [Kitasatospora sp. NPDC052868]|uniref:DciA family protein n=1 Tax=Kitasatospora sp. NPDC052868 TaxID=3364060 RepID=UPI0037CA746F
MSSTPSGIDLARQALAAARANSKNLPRQETTGPARKSLRTRPKDAGREPVSLAGALEGLLRIAGWDTGVAGGDLVADWPVLAPELAGGAVAEHFDERTGTLHLRPISRAWGTQLRYAERQIVTGINRTLKRDLLSHLRILEPGPSRTPQSGPAPNPQPAAAEATGPARGPHAEAATALDTWRRNLATAHAAAQTENDQRIAAVRARLRPFGPDLREPETDPTWTRVRDQAAETAGPESRNWSREPEDDPAWTSIRD